MLQNFIAPSYSISVSSAGDADIILLFAYCEYCAYAFDEVIYILPDDLFFYLFYESILDIDDDFELILASAVSIDENLSYQ